MQDRSPQAAYLETQIATATPQRLRLMLVEGALRLARSSAESWSQDRKDEARESLSRCRSIVTELIAGIRAGSSPLADKVLGIYLFLFQELTEAQFRNDPTKIDGVIDVLEEERATWQEVCLTLPDHPQRTLDRDAGEIRAPAYVAHVQERPSSAESISFEA